MSRIIYYIGAGASFGKRDVRQSIIEGLPVVAEIPRQFELFRHDLARVGISETDSLIFQNKYKCDSAQLEMSKQEMLSDIDFVMRGVEGHATIDTYARKLFLTEQKHDFLKLKSILCSFFIWTQLAYKPDSRYDTFLANVLQEGSLSLPSEISIISWNYDAQFETAYKAYNTKNVLPVFEKNIQGEWPELPNSGVIFKINGSASFIDQSSIDYIKFGQDKMPALLQLIEIYKNSYVDTRAIGVDYKTHLSFAWEESRNAENMQKSLASCTEGTEIVIVIGYSFPFFNRETDRRIFNEMPTLKKIYVQDLNTDAVMQSIRAVLPTNKKIEIVPIKDCGQFYLPAEM